MIPFGVQVREGYPVPQENASQTGALTVGPSAVPTSVPLGPTTSLDLSWLDETARRTLLTEYTRGILDVSKKAQELHVDVAVLKSTLTTLAGTTKEVAESGNSVTVSHTTSTNVGRTEVIMGNTGKAQSGKLTPSQTGARDWTPYYIIGGLIAAVLIAAMFAH
jgi:hypothetical protein